MADTLFINGTVILPAWLNDVNRSVYNTLSAVAGTNAITATGPQGFTSYFSGQVFFLNPAVTNTGAVTINVSGLGIKSIVKNGGALVAGDLIAGIIAQLYYDGVNFQLANPQTLFVGPVGFRAHNNGVGTVLPTGVFTTLLMGTETFDSGGFFASNAWTPPAGKLISVSGTMTFTPAGAGAGTISIYKNGVELARGVQVPISAATYALHVSTQDLPNGTDVYTLRVFQNTGASITCDGTAANTWFSGCRM